MNALSKLIVGAALSVAASVAGAATTLTFSTNTSGTSYTEGGMTITATSAEPVRTNGANWFLDCCDPGPETFSLTTGGTFDLLSVLRVHVDGSDPVTWQGFLNGVLVATNSYNSGQGAVFNFTGFTGLDLVTVSTSGNFTDPRFDNLTFEAAAAAVPEPGAFALLAIGLAAAAFARRRKVS